MRYLVQFLSNSVVNVRFGSWRWCSQLLWQSSRFFTYFRALHSAAELLAYVCGTKQTDHCQCQFLDTRVGFYLAGNCDKSIRFVFEVIVGLKFNKLHLQISWNCLWLDIKEICENFHWCLCYIKSRKSLKFILQMLDNLCSVFTWLWIACWRTWNGLKTGLIFILELSHPQLKFISQCSDMWTWPEKGDMLLMSLKLLIFQKLLIRVDMCSVMQQVVFFQRSYFDSAGNTDSWMLRLWLHNNLWKILPSLFTLLLLAMTVCILCFKQFAIYSTSGISCKQPSISQGVV